MARSNELRGFRGLRNDTSSERFDAEDLEVASNVDLDATGKLMRRAGSTSRYAGSPHSLWSDGSMALFVESALKRLNPDYSATTLRAGLTGGRMRYQPVNGRVYYSNGIETGVVENGASRSWGVTAPANPGNAAVATGSLHAGTYQYTVTFIRSDGQESGAPLARTLDVPEGGAIVFSALPVSSDPGVAYKAVYLSTPNGETLYRALVLANSDTAATYSNDSADLQVALETQFFEPAPAGHEIAYWRGHLFVAVGNLIRYSQPYGYEWFDPRDFLPVDSHVTLLAPVDDGIYIASETKTWFMTGETPSALALAEKAPYGAVPYTLAYQEPQRFADGSASGPVALWTSNAGICAGSNGGAFENITGGRYRHAEALAGAAVVRFTEHEVPQYLVALTT